MDNRSNSIIDKHRTILVIGGTGFIGCHVIARLAQTDFRVIVPTRNYERAKHLLELPMVDDVIQADVHDDATLRQLIQWSDTVVNLVGILHSSPGNPYGPEFAKAHVELPRRIVDICASFGHKRYLHMSALGARGDAPSMYLRSKADGERAAFSNAAVATTVFRPSVVFGEGDHLLNMFASLQKYLPVLPLAHADAKFQPVYVGDVADAFLHAMLNDRTIGHVCELAGPNVYTLRELVHLAGVYSGHERPIIDLPDSLAQLQAMIMEHLPGDPLLTRDNLASMSVDNVASGPVDEELWLNPGTTIESVAPYYLSGQRPHTGVETVHVPKQ